MSALGRFTRPWAVPPEFLNEHCSAAPLQPGTTYTPPSLIVVADWPPEQLERGQELALDIHVVNDGRIGVSDMLTEVHLSWRGPTDAEPYLALAQVELEAKRPEEAVKAIEQLGTALPGEPLPSRPPRT